MPVDAFLLALGAAALHAGWNILVARAEDVRAATTVALCLSVVLFAPVAAATWDVERLSHPVDRALGGARARVLPAAHDGLSRLGREPRLPDRTRCRAGARARRRMAGRSDAGSPCGRRGRARRPRRAARARSDRTGRPARRPARPRHRRPRSPATRSPTTKASSTRPRSRTSSSCSRRWRSWRCVAHIASPAGPRILRAEVGLASVAAALGSFGAYALVLAALELAPAASVAAVSETSVLFAVALGAVVLHERVTRRPRRRCGAHRRRRRRRRTAWRKAVLAILLTPIFTGSAKWARGAHFS